MWAPTHAREGWNANIEQMPPKPEDCERARAFENVNYYSEKKALIVIVLVEKLAIKNGKLKATEKER